MYLLHTVATLSYFPFGFPKRDSFKTKETQIFRNSRLWFLADLSGVAGWNYDYQTGMHTQDFSYKRLVT